MKPSAVHARFNELAKSIRVKAKLVVDEQKALQGRTHATGRALARAFACTDGHTVWVRPKLLTQPPERVDGILMHELAHCWCIQNGHEEHTERECDDVAKELFGVTLSYDEDDVQTTADGVRPRPEYLPNPSKVVTLEDIATAPLGVLLLSRDGVVAWRKTGPGKFDWTPQKPVAGSADGWGARRDDMDAASKRSNIKNILRELDSGLLLRT